jgi:hypothetical protein
MKLLLMVMGFNKVEALEDGLRIPCCGIADLSIWCAFWNF